MHGSRCICITVMTHVPPLIFNPTDAYAHIRTKDATSHPTHHTGQWSRLFLHVVRMSQMFHSIERYVIGNVQTMKLINTGMHIGIGNESFPDSCAHDV